MQSIVDNRLSRIPLDDRTLRPTPLAAPTGGPVSHRTADAVPTASYADGFRHEPLRNLVANALREAILSGALRPGDPLVETGIADEFAISRAPVREAIRMLSEEGLVESVPYKGSRVRHLTRRDVREVYGVRGLLERFALELLLARHDPDLRGLQSACEQMTAAAEAGDAAALNRADEQLHRTLIELADHELLLSLWNQIELRARQIIALRNDQMGDPATVARNHRAIVSAIFDGNASEALALLEDHVASGASLVLEEWEEPA